MTSPLATAFVLIRPTTTGFGPTLKRDLEGQAGAAGAAGKKTGQAWTKGFQSSGVTKAANKITEGIVGVGVVSVVAAAKFQSAMEKIHTQAGVAQGKIKDLGDGILTLAGQVGFSPDSLATSLYHVESSFESLGITSKKALQLVKIAAEGAAVGGADLEDVTNALTAVMASGIKVTGGFSGAMGVLNAVVGVGDMKMQDLADAFGTGLLASIKGFGVSITDAGAALATFGDNNIRGAKAGTQLRMAIQALAAPTGAGKKILEGWGLSMSTLAKDMQKGGLKLALEDLQHQFEKFHISTKQQGQYLTELFGKRAGVGIQILLGQMDRFQSKYAALSKASGSFGDAWKKTQATASQQFKELTQGLVAVGVSIGEKLLPPVMAVFNFIRTHTTLVLTLAAVVGTLAVAISAVSFAIKLYEAYTAIATAAQWLWNAALYANPIGIVVVAIAALVAGIIYAYTHFKGFRDVVTAVWSAIKTGAVDAWHALQTAFHAIAAVFATVWDALKAAFDWVHEHWKLLAALLFGPIGLAVDAIVTHWAFIVHAFKDLWQWIKDAWNAVYDWIIAPIVKAVKLIWGTEFKILMKAFTTVWGWLKTAWQFVYDYIVKPIGKAVAFIFDAWKRVLASVANLIVKIKNFFAPAINWLVNAGKNVIGGLFNGMWHAVQAAASWVAKIGGKILSAVTNFFGIHSPSTVFFKIGGHLISGLFKGMVHGASGLVSWVIKQISHIGGSILSHLIGFLGGGGGPGSPGKATGTYQNYAAKILPSFGWPSREMSPLIALWNRESSWNPIAQNPTSTAYGIAQFLDSTWGPYGSKTSDGYKQVFYGLEYIRDRYGSPSAAWAHETAFGWYDKGGWLPAGLSLAYNGTGRPERVLGPGQRADRGVVVQFRGGGSKFDRFMLEWIRDNVRIAGGGNVQVAFGRDY